MLYAPASLVLDANADRIASLLAGQLAWLVLLGALTLLVSRGATARITHAGI
jgi:hypothetical protein